jgi:hypothetical protein
VKRMKLKQVERDCPIVEHFDQWLRKCRYTDSRGNTIMATRQQLTSAVMETKHCFGGIHHKTNNRVGTVQETEGQVNTEADCRHTAVEIDGKGLPSPSSAARTAFPCGK